MKYSQRLLVLLMLTALLLSVCFLASAEEKNLLFNGSFEEIGQWIRGAKHYYLQKFTDRETVPFEGLHAPTDEQMRGWVNMLRPLIPAVEVRGVE